MKKIQLFLLMIAVLARISANDVLLVPANQIMAGQETVSYTVCQNVRDNTFKRSVGYSITSAGVEFIAHNQKSPFLEPFSVVQTPEGFERPYILVDGHHTLRGTLDLIQQHGLNLDDILVPVRINVQFKDYSPETFWGELKTAGLVYLGENAALPCRDIMTLANNELRTFLDATVVTFSRTKPVTYAHPEYHLWLRIGMGSTDSSIPFIEYYMAEALEAAGFEYNSLIPLTRGLVTQARAILMMAERNADMKLIDNDGIVLSSRLTIDQEYEAFVSRNRCS